MTHINISLISSPNDARKIENTLRKLVRILQIMGRAFDEERIFKVAYAYEQATEWNKQKAKL